MLKSNDEMHRVIAHFIGRLLRLEIKCAETAVAVSGDRKLRVQIEHALALQIDDAQIRISILSTATPVPIAASRGPALPIVCTMRSAPTSATLASTAARVFFVRLCFLPFSSWSPLERVASAPPDSFIYLPESHCRGALKTMANRSVGNVPFMQSTLCSTWLYKAKLYKQFLHFSLHYRFPK